MPWHHVKVQCKYRQKVRKDKELPAFLVCFNQKSRVIGCEWAGKQGIIVCKTIKRKRNEFGLIQFNLEHESNESNESINGKLMIN